MPHPKKKVGDKEVIEYFHRYVVCQIVLCSIPAILDIEPILPGEGETIAAARMLRRILDEQPRMVDVFTCDALYADANVLKILNKARKWWVVVLKQEAREAYSEIDRLLPSAAPISFHANDAHVILCDFHGLTAWDALNAPFRAVVSEEKKWRCHLNNERKREKFLETSHWRWLTNLPDIYSAQTVHRFGHARWDIENRGFNELSNFCHLNHPFHHHPNALHAMLWLICIAFTITRAFFSRNLKPQLRSRIKTICQLVEEFRLSFTRAIKPLCPQGYT